MSEFSTPCSNPGWRGGGAGILLIPSAIAYTQAIPILAVIRIPRRAAGPLTYNLDVSQRLEDSHELFFLRIIMLE